MKIKLILLALLIQGLLTITNAQTITILSPKKGDVVTLGPDRMIQVVIQSDVETNAWISVDALGAGDKNYEISSAYISWGDGIITAGTTTNTYQLPDYNPFGKTLYGGDSFVVKVSLETTTGPYPGLIIPYAQSGKFALSDVPMIAISPNADEVWRPGKTNNVTYTWHNMGVGDPYEIGMVWTDDKYVVGESYGLKLDLASGTFATSDGTNTIQVAVPAGVVAGRHQLRIINTNNWANNFSSAWIYVGTSNAPTAAKINAIISLDFPILEIPLGVKPGQVILQCEGLPNTGYQIQETTDMVNWVTSTTVSSSTPSGSFYVQNGVPDTTNRFYRLLQVP